MTYFAVSCGVSTWIGCSRSDRQGSGRSSSEQSRAACSVGDARADRAGRRLRLAVRSGRTQRSSVDRAGRRLSRPAARLRRLWSSAAPCIPTRTTASPWLAREERVPAGSTDRASADASASASAPSWSLAQPARASGPRASPRSGGSTSALTPAGAADPVLGVLPGYRDRLPVAPLHLRTSPRGDGARAQPRLHAGVPARPDRRGRSSSTPR